MLSRLFADLSQGEGRRDFGMFNALLDAFRQYLKGKVIEGS